MSDKSTESQSFQIHKPKLWEAGAKHNKTKNQQTNKTRKELKQKRKKDLETFSPFKRR